MKDLKYAKTKEQKEYWKKLRPINLATASDTYKRTMSGSSELFSQNKAIYYSAARRPLKEEESGQLIVAGIEKTLYPWMGTKFTQEELDSAKEFFTKKAQVKKFPEKAWQAVIENDGYLPIDIYGLPGGQTIIAKDGKHVPLMVVEGIGALASHIEAQLETMYAPIIQATKAKRFQEVVGDKFAEFGLRSEETLVNHPTLMMALKVGGNFEYTSDDQSVYLFDEFKDIGTLGHEFIMAYQKEGKSLEEAQKKAFEDFVEQNDKAALLADTIDTVKSGMPQALEQILKNPNKQIVPRFDSGDVPGQCITWKEMTLEAGLKTTGMVVEDGYTPEKAKKTFDLYKENGFDPKEIVTGAGGYFRQNCTRDEISLAYKRSATFHEDGMHTSLKFSDSPGKESIPGNIRLYEVGNKLVVAQAHEEIVGKPLMVKLVENGRILYNESLEKQNQRVQETWNKYDDIEYSPHTQKLIQDRLEEKQYALNNLEEAII